MSIPTIPTITVGTNIPNDIYIYIYIYCIYSFTTLFVTRPAKRDQVGTKYTISQYGTYHEFYVQYLLSVSCKMLPMQLLIDSKILISIALADH